MTGKTVRQTELESEDINEVFRFELLLGGRKRRRKSSRRRRRR